MTNYEFWTIVIAGLGLVVSIFALIISLMASLNSKKNNSATIELAINQMITNTKHEVSNRIDKVADIISKDNPSSDERNKLEILTRQLNAAVENNLNSYEEACAKYLDKKVDKTRFKKLYKQDIKKLVENQEYKTKYFDGVVSSYKCILKVYKEWEDLEK